MPINAEKDDKKSGKLQSLEEAARAAAMVRTTIYMRKDFHKMLKNHCNDLEISVSQYILNLAYEDIEKWKKKH